MKVTHISNRAGQLIADAAGQAMRLAPADNLACACHEVGFLRGTVRALCAEIEQHTAFKTAADLRYVQVEHDQLGAITLGVEYTPAEEFDADAGPATAADVCVCEVWLADRNIHQALDLNVFDGLCDLAMAAIEAGQRDDELAWAERRAA